MFQVFNRIYCWIKEQRENTHSLKSLIIALVGKLHGSISCQPIMEIINNFGRWERESFSWFCIVVKIGGYLVTIHAIMETNR